MTDEELPPIPGVRWSKLLADQREFRHIFSPHVGKDLAGEVLQDIVGRLKSKFPASVSFDVLQLSVSHIVGAKITEDVVATLADQLAAQRDQIAAGTPLTLSSDELAGVWAAAVVTQARYHRRDNKSGIMIRFRLLTTIAAPAEFSQWWSTEKTKYLAYYRDERRIGFGFRYTRTNKVGETSGGPAYVHPQQFFGLRCFLYLKERRGDRWVVGAVRHSSMTMSHNAQLLRGRDREISPCAMDILFTKDCWSCPIGLDVCEFATHSRSYVETTCSCCGAAGCFAREHPVCETCAVKE